MALTLCQKCRTHSTLMTSEEDRQKIHDSLKSIQDFIKKKDVTKLNKTPSNYSTKKRQKARRYKAIYKQVNTNGRLKFNNATLNFISSLLKENKKTSPNPVLTFETTHDLDTEIKRTFLSVINNYLTKLEEPIENIPPASIYKVIQELTSIVAYMGKALDKPFPANYETSFQIKNDTDHSIFIIPVVDKKLKALETYITNTTLLVDSLVSNYIKNTHHTLFSQYVNDVLYEANRENKNDKKDKKSKSGKTNWAILYHTAHLLEKLARLSERDTEQTSPERQKKYEFKEIHKIVSSSVERIVADEQTIKKDDKNEFITRLKDIKSIEQIDVKTKTLREPAVEKPYDHRDRDPNTNLTILLRNKLTDT